MGIYIVIFVILICLSFIRKGDKALKPVFMSLVILLICMAGFKGVGIGFDYENYAIRMYKDGDTNLLEPGFSFLLTIFRPFQNVNFFFLFVAAVAIALKSFVIYKYSYFPILSLMVYFSIAFIMNDMGQIRYGLAMSFMSFGLIRLAEFKKRVFWILACCSVLVHYSAACAIPVYYIVNRQLSSRIIILLCLVFSIFTFVHIDSFLLGAMRYIPLEHVNSKIVEYVISEAVDPLGFNMSLILRLFFLYMFYVVIKKKRYDSFFLNGLFNMYFYGILWYMLFNSVSEFATRGSGYFKILDIIIIPYIIYHTKPKLVKLSIIFVTILYSAYSIQKILFDADFAASYVPYKTVFFFNETYLY